MGCDVGATQPPHPATLPRHPPAYPATPRGAPAAPCPCPSPRTIQMRPPTYGRGPIRHTPGVARPRTRSPYAVGARMELTRGYYLRPKPVRSPAPPLWRTA